MHQPDGMLKLGGRYQMIKHLGGGGFGQTYLAEDTHLPGNPLCVVKHLKPKLSDALVWETAHRLFETEAQVLYKLNEYNQIPRLLAHFEEHQEFYLVQEFIEGENLSKELAPGIQLSENQVIVLLQDVLQVLVYIHQHHLIHRDLKPSNLIRRKRDHRIVVIDFGAVKQLSAQVIQTHGHTTRTIAIGSPGYMPSEQMAGKPRYCSDLYAIGMIGIQALTGMHPKELPEDAKTSELIWRDRAQVSSEFADILDRMIRYDFRQRYQSALEILADLAPLAITRAIAAPPFSVPVAQTIQVNDRSDRTEIEASIKQPESHSQTTVDIDYTPLRELLAARSWRQADQATQRLMVQICGREAGRLRIEEIRQFPCDALYMIDYLWLDYSNGLFGFSLQKEIWQSVGGRLDTNYETWEQLSSSRAKWRVNSPWHRFGNRVVWRMKEQWLTYDRLNFSLDAVKGHLPSWQLVSPNPEKSAKALVMLFARTEVCQPYVPKIDITQKP